MPLPGWPKDKYTHLIVRVPAALNAMLNALWHGLGAKMPDATVYKSDLIRLAILEYCERRKELLGDNFDFEKAKAETLDLIKL